MIPPLSCHPVSSSRLCSLHSCFLFTWHPLVYLFINLFKWIYLSNKPANLTFKWNISLYFCYLSTGSSNDWTWIVIRCIDRTLNQLLSFSLSRSLTYSYTRGAHMKRDNISRYMFHSHFLLLHSQDTVYFCDATTTSGNLVRHLLKVKTQLIQSMDLNVAQSIKYTF